MVCPGSGEEKVERWWGLKVMIVQLWWVWRRRYSILCRAKFAE